MPLLFLNLSTISIAFFNFSTSVNFTIPTPFSNKPFEFTIGFRKTFFASPIAYFLTYMSVSVGNFNLGVFSILLIVMICYSYDLVKNKDLSGNRYRLHHQGNYMPTSRIGFAR